MRDPKRIKKILDKIEEIWKKDTNLRLTQLIGNCFEPGDLYHIEDDKLLEKLEKAYEYLQ